MKTRVTEGKLTVGSKFNGMVFLTVPVKTPADLFFTPDQARDLARQLIHHADEADKIRSGGRGAFQS
jgi:hypothetical protein